MSDTSSGDSAPKGAGSEGTGQKGPASTANPRKKGGRRWRPRRRKPSSKGRRDGVENAAQQPSDAGQPIGFDKPDASNIPRKRGDATNTRSSDTGGGAKGRHHGQSDQPAKHADDSGMRADGRRRGKRWRNRHKNQQKNVSGIPTDKPSADADTASTPSANRGLGRDGHPNQNSDKRRRTRRPNRSKHGDQRRAKESADHGSNKGAQTLDPANAPQPSVSQNAFVAPAIAYNKAPPAYAALDLGTNNCRLLVATPQQPGRFRVIDAFSRIVRLGEGLGATGRLSDAAMDRAVSALQACATKLKSRNMNGVRLIATEACRRATNGADFLDRVEREAGLKLEIVDRETEARLAVAGCASLVDREARGVVLFDIGGGSSELALLDLNKRKRHDLGPAMISWTSLPLGVVTLSEKHGGGRLVTQAVFDTMVDEVTQMIAEYEGRDALASVFERGEVHLLGTSGTVTTLAGIHLNLPKYDRRKVDGVWMSSRQVTQMIDGLVAMGYEERVKNPCIGHDRADLVLAGCAILAAIQRTWPCERLRVADRGLREGLLTEMMNRDNAWVRRSGGGGGRAHPKPPHKKREHGPQDRSQQ